MTTPEKIQLIDDYLEEPNSIDQKWVVMISEYRGMLTRDVIAENERLKKQLDALWDYIDTVDNNTVGNYMIPQIQIAYASGEMPRMLPMLEGHQ